MAEKRQSREHGARAELCVKAFEGLRTQSEQGVAGAKRWGEDGRHAGYQKPAEETKTCGPDRRYEVHKQPPDFRVCLAQRNSWPEVTLF